MRERGKSWQIDIHFTHERHFATLPKSEYTYEQARQFEAELRKGLGKPKLTAKVDINSVYRDYLEWVELHQAPPTLRLKRYLLITHLLPFFGAITPDRITEGLITTYKKKRKGEVISATSKGNNRMINLELLTLRHLCKRMFKEKINAELLPDKRQLPTVLTVEEVKRFMDALEPKYKLFFMLMYQTGMRKSEALNLKWSDIHGNNVTIRGKGGTCRITPLSSVVIDNIVSAKELSVGDHGVTDGRVFPFVNPYKAIGRAKKIAGITKRIYPHLLRHSLGLHLMDATGDLRGIQEILGHKSSKTTEIYTQISMEHKKGLLEAVHGNKSW